MNFRVQQKTVNCDDLILEKKRQQQCKDFVYLFIFRLSMSMIFRDQRLEKFKNFRSIKRNNNLNFCDEK